MYNTSVPYQKKVQQGDDEEGETQNDPCQDKLLFDFHGSAFLETLVLAMTSFENLALFEL